MFYGMFQKNANVLNAHRGNLYKVVLLMAALTGGFVVGCPVYGLFGVTCPCCGVTRAWLAFFRGELSLAFQYHALFPVIPVVALLYILRDKIGCLKTRIMDIVLALLGGAIFIYALMRWTGFVDIP